MSICTPAEGEPEGHIMVEHDGSRNVASKMVPFLLKHVVLYQVLHNRLLYH